jgi:hypothetical protein
MYFNKTVIYLIFFKGNDKNYFGRARAYKNSRNMSFNLFGLLIFKLKICSQR